MYGMFVRLMMWAVFIPMLICYAAPLPPQKEKFTRNTLPGTWAGSIAGIRHDFKFDDDGTGWVIRKDNLDCYPVGVPIMWRIHDHELVIQFMDTTRIMKVRLERNAWRGKIMGSGNYFELLYRLANDTYTR